VHKGQKMSEEQRQKISKALTGKKLSEEHKHSISVSRKGQKASKETKIKMSESQFKRHKEYDIHPLVGKKLSEETKLKMSKSHTTRLSKMPNKEMGKRMSKSALSKEPSAIERATHNVLNKWEIKYIPQYPIGRYVVDIFIPCCNLVIECDSSGHNKARQKEEDKKRDSWLRSKDYTIIRLTETAINENAEAALLKEIG